jgi:hypothetical protein
MRAVMSLVALLAFMAPAHAQSREVTGQAGILGEWELTATGCVAGVPALALRTCRTPV